MILLLFFLSLLSSISALNETESVTLNLNPPLSSSSVSEEHDFALINSAISSLDKNIHRTMVPSLIRYKGMLDESPLLQYEFVYSIRADIKIDNYQRNGSYIGIAFLDKNYDLVGTPRLLSIPPERNPEDARPFLFKGDLFFSYNFATSSGRQMALYEFSSDKIINLSLKNFTTSPIEKNWSFFELDDQLAFVYCYDPFVVFSADLTSGDCMPLFCKENTLPDVSEKILRGGSSPMKVNNNLFLSFIHSRIRTSSLNSPLLFINDFLQKKLLWLYRPHICLFSTDPYKVLYISEQFSLYNTGIEYPVSTVVRDQDLLVSFNVDDHISSLISFNNLLPSLSNDLEAISHLPASSSSFENKALYSLTNYPINCKNPFHHPLLSILYYYGYNRGEGRMQKFLRTFEGRHPRNLEEMYLKDELKKK